MPRLAWGRRRDDAGRKLEPTVSMADVLWGARSRVVAKARSERKCGEEWKSVRGRSAWCLEGRDARPRGGNATSRMAATSGTRITL
jgi:hypothetical protein